MSDEDRTRSAANKTSPGKRRAKRLRVPIDAVPRASERPPAPSVAEELNEGRATLLDIPTRPMIPTNLDITQPMPAMTLEQAQAAAVAAGEVDPDITQKMAPIEVDVLLAASIIDGPDLASTTAEVVAPPGSSTPPAELDLDVDVVLMPASDAPPAQLAGMQGMHPWSQTIPAPPSVPTVANAGEDPNDEEGPAHPREDVDVVIEDETLLEPDSLPPQTRPNVSAPPPPPRQIAASGEEGVDPQSRIVTERPPGRDSVEPSRASKPVAADGKKRQRGWWDEFFNDDYLRTWRAPNEAQVRRQCDFIERSLGLMKGAHILDVGAGLGLQAVELAARGYNVTALDASNLMIARTQDEARERGVHVNVLHQDARELAVDGEFDAVLCLNTTFGYFDDDSNRQLLERFRRALKPRGVLLLETVNRDFVLRDQPSMTWFEGDGCLCMEETQFNYFTSRLHVKRTLILEGRQRETEYPIRLYPLHELGLLMTQTGYRVIEVSGMEATPGVYFGTASPKLIMLAERKPDASLSPERGALGEEKTRRSSIPAKRDPNDKNG